MELEYYEQALLEAKKGLELGIADGKGNIVSEFKGYIKEQEAK